MILEEPGHWLPGAWSSGHIAGLGSLVPVSWFCALYHNTLFAFEQGLLRMRSMICHLQSYFEE